MPGHAGVKIHGGEMNMSVLETTVRFDPWLCFFLMWFQYNAQYNAYFYVYWCTSFFYVNIIVVVWFIQKYTIHRNVCDIFCMANFENIFYRTLHSNFSTHVFTHEILFFFIFTIQTVLQSHFFKWLKIIISYRHLLFKVFLFLCSRSSTLEGS